MKTCLRVACIGVTLLCTIIGTGRLAGQTIGDGIFDQPAIQPGLANIDVGWPGRFYVGVTLAEQGLGFQGSYVTLGAKRHLFQDFLDGRWLLDTRGHYDPEFEGFFGNVGLERVFTLRSAGAEITTGFWFDYDSTNQADFSNDLMALGLSASVETRGWELLGNGYFPIGDTDFALGDPTGANNFFGNSIVLQPGIDSALQGFDALLRFKPAGLATINGTFGFGGYQYASDLVDSFAGVRARVSFQLDSGMIVSGELNHDDRFDFSGGIQIGWLFGAGARGTEYGFLGTDLDPTIRNEHVVRFQQDLQLAIDPDTGLPYNVFHVDNTAVPGGDGSFENPFNALADAEAASAADDVIFVNFGDGTTNNQDQGIALQEGQLLLGAGVQHILPLLGGTNVVLTNPVDGLIPTITNTGLGNGVDLAGRNTVRGFVIDGSAGGLVNGISGDTGATITDGIIEDVTITGNPILNGVLLDNIAGDWIFARNNIQTAFLDGINIQNAVDPNSIFTFQDNVVSANLRDGIHIDNFDAALVNFVDNETDDNDRDGIRIENHINSLGTGTFLNFLDNEVATVAPGGPTDPTAQGNGNNGISVFDVVGNVNFLNMEIRDNLNTGISLVNVTTPGIDDMVFIGTSNGGVSVFDNNGAGTGAGVFNDLGVAGGVQELLITDTTFLNGGIGIMSSATAAGAFLETNIIDNNGILAHASDGIQLNSSGGATHIANVTNAGPALAITGSGNNGVSLNSSGAGPISLLQANIDNVAIAGVTASGIQSTIIENGQVVAMATNTTITGAVDAINITADNDASTAVNQFIFDNITATTIVDDGVDLNVLDQTFVDFQLFNSTFDNSATVAGLGNNGLEITATGDALAAVDTRLRLNIVNNTIDSFDSGDGIDITTFGDARVLAEINGNDIVNNGTNMQIVGAPTLPFGDGIEINATGTSAVFTRILNNNITGNAEAGFDLNTLGAGQITTVLAFNNITGNDTADDPATPAPVIESGNVEATADNAIAGNICIALSNNLFNLPVIFTNLSAPANFRVELDGLTNGVGVPVFVGGPGNFEMGPFGSQCELDIQAEEAAFALDGFPPIP